LLLRRISFWERLFLRSLRQTASSLISELCESVEPEDQLIQPCDKLLTQYKLTPEEFDTTHLEFFE